MKYRSMKQFRERFYPSEKEVKPTDPEEFGRWLADRSIKKLRAAIAKARSDV